MADYPRYHVEMVPRSAIRKGDTLLHITRRTVYELRVKSAPRPLGQFAMEVDVCWPGEATIRGFSLGERGTTHLRVVKL